MSNVVILPVVTCLDLDSSRVLDAAREADLDGCVVIGYGKDGSEYFSSSIADGGSVLWALERAKLRLLRTADGDHSAAPPTEDVESRVLPFPMITPTITSATIATEAVRQFKNNMDMNNLVHRDRDTQKHVAFEVSSNDLTLTIEEFSTRYIQPAVTELARQVGPLMVVNAWLGAHEATPASFMDRGAARGRCIGIVAVGSGPTVVLDPAALDVDDAKPQHEPGEKLLAVINVMTFAVPV